MGVSQGREKSEPKSPTPNACLSPLFPYFQGSGRDQEQIGLFFSQTPPCTGAGAFDSLPPVEVSICKSASETFGLRTL